MKRLCTILAFTIVTPAMAQNEASVAASFKKLVAECRALNPKTYSQRLTYFPKTGNWQRRIGITSVRGYDVKRSDSIMSPYIGILSLSSFAEYSNFESEQEALSAPIKLPKVDKGYVNLNFNFIDGKWLPNSFQTFIALDWKDELMASPIEKWDSTLKDGIKDFCS